jgi:hypothetical protein
MFGRQWLKMAFSLALAGAVAGGAVAQVRAVDPNEALAKPEFATQANTSAPAEAKAPELQVDTRVPADGETPTGPNDVVTDAAGDAAIADSVAAREAMKSAAANPPTTGTPTYRKDDLIGAAEGVFGKGAKGLAELIEKILKDQGEPNAYIAGREASGALVVGLRYGSGTMSHSVEGTRPVYWTGPSLGFDVGGDATKAFVLVYNLYDSQDLYKRFPQAEGRAYFVGGFSASYLRRGNVVVIPVRLGVGVRLGANVGYMKFSEKSRWVPF